jgi:AraC-like DNA-binding protein
VRPSEALLVPPGRTYGSSIRTSELTDSFSVFFPTWWLQAILTKSPAEHVDRMLERGGPLVSLPLTAEASSSLREFAETLTQADGDRLAAQETLAVLTHRIFLLVEAAGELAGRIHAANPSTRLELLRRVSRVRDLLESRVQSGVSLAELSREACLSEFHLLRVFKQAFGTTPARYLERRRMERARDLLHATGLPIAEVAASCGYSNLSAFGRAFRRAWGTSATSLRDERSAIPVRLTS